MKWLPMGVALLLIMGFAQGCARVAYLPLPDNMVLVEHHYTDWPTLAAICGGDAEACAIVAGNVCTIHLPLAWNGDPLHREHEISHCAGKVDAPKPIKRYFPE